MKSCILIFDGFDILDPRGNPTVRVSFPLDHPAVFGK